MPIPKKKPITKEISNTGESTNNANTSAENTSNSQSLDAMMLDDDILNLDLDDLDFLEEGDSNVSTAEPAKDPEKEPESNEIVEEQSNPGKNDQSTEESQVEKTESNKEESKEETSENPEKENTKVEKKEDEDTFFMQYSSRAASDGYSFKELPIEEQRMTRYLYRSEDSLSNFYFVIKRADELTENPEANKYFKYDFKLPDGWYLGFIIGCKESYSGFGSRFTLKILVSQNDVRCFNFEPGGFGDPVSAAIKRELKLRNNIFNTEWVSELAGYFVLFKVENETSKNGNSYCNLKDFHFLTNKELNVTKKMINIMFNQSQN